MPPASTSVLLISLLLFIFILFHLLPTPSSLIRLPFVHEALPHHLDTITVATVIDGDTLKTVEGEKIRLYGIDAPETSQPFGMDSLRQFQEIIISENGKLLILRKDIDPYGRTVAIVYRSSNKENINRNLVERGLAWAYVYFTREYEEEEKEAKKERRGLWTDPNPVNPYDFRKKKPSGRRKDL